MRDRSRYEVGNLAPKAALTPESAFTIDVHSAVSPAFAVDMDQRIVAWNAAAEVCFGHPVHEAIGRSCGEVVHACHANGSPLCAPFCPAVANARRGRPARSIEAITTTAEPPRHLEMNFMIARSTLGQRRVIHLVRDITDQHRVGESVARALAHTGYVAPEDASSPRWPAPLPAAAPPMTASHTTHATHATHATHMGEPAIAPHLTRREQEVLELLVCGMATHDIAAALSISPLTARNHVTRVMEKLGVTTRLQAVVAASRLHLV